MVTVYLSNQKLQILQGSGGRRPSAERAWTLDAPEKSIINGIVTDEAALQEMLRAFWQKEKLPAKKVQLVISSTQLNCRTTKIPRQNRRAVTAYLAREFAENGAGENGILAWDEISRDDARHTLRVEATLTQQSYLQSLVDLFAGIGVTLSGITPARAAAIAVLQRLLQPQHASIVQIADGSNLVSFLLADGSYLYSSSQRMFGQPGTAQYGEEAARQASSILQFVQAQRLETKVERVYLAGMQPETENVCAASLQQLAAGLTVLRLHFTQLGGAAAPMAEQYVYALGGLLLAGNKNDLLHGLRDGPAAERTPARTLHYAAPALAAAAAAAVAAGALGAVHTALQAQDTALQNYLSSSTVMQGVADYTLLEQQNAVLSGSVQDAQDIWAALESYPQANSALKDAIRLSTSGYAVTLSFSSYDAATGQLNLQTTAATVEIINQYISVLQQQDIFEKVDYTGYTFNAASADWTVNVTCTLSGQAGK